MISRVVQKELALLATVLSTAANPVVSQTAARNFDCDHVTIQGSANINRDTGGIDWLALTNQTDPNAIGEQTSEGCLIDTQNVSVDQIISSDETGAAIMDLVASNDKIHTAGSSTGGYKDQESQRISAEEEYSRTSWSEAIKEQSPLLLFLLALVPVTLVASLVLLILFAIRGSVQRGARRFTCKLVAKVLVEDQEIPGRLTRISANSCQFVPNATRGADLMAGILMRSDLPDFDLELGGQLLPIVLETPGSRFTSLYFVKPLSASKLNKLMAQSETPARKETKRPKLVQSPHRERMRTNRLRRLQAT